MGKIIKGAPPSKEEIILKGKLLWEFFNKNTETNIRIFIFWFILIFALVLFVINTSEKTNNLDLGLTISIVAAGATFYILSFYYNKRKYFRYVKQLAQKSSEFGSYEIDFRPESVSYKDSKFQFSYPWYNVKTFTIYKNNLLLLFGGLDVRHSIILNRAFTGDQEFGEIKSYIEEQLKTTISWSNLYSAVWSLPQVNFKWKLEVSDFLLATGRKAKG